MASPPRHPCLRRTCPPRQSCRTRNTVAGAPGQEALRLAAHDGREGALTALLVAGVDPALPGADGRTALELAARAGRVACVHALLPHLNQRAELLACALNATRDAQVVRALGAAAPQLLLGPAGGDALEQAVRDGRCDVAKALLDLGAGEQRRRNLAVLLALPGSDAKCVKVLLEGVPDNAAKTEIVRLIIEKSNSSVVLQRVAQAAPTLFRAALGESALSAAVREGRCAAVAALLAAGAGNATDDAQEALEEAVRAEDAACAWTLRAGGVAPLAGPRWEREILRAAESGRREALRALLAAGVGVDARDASECTALILAAKLGFADAVGELLNANASVDIIDKYGYTALIHSSGNGHLEVVRLLLDANAQVNIRSKAERTALILASQFGHTDIVSELLKANANVDICDNNGDTPLIRASENHHSEVVGLLLSANAKVNVRNKSGRTALLSAARHYSTLIELMKANPKVDISDNDGYTALMRASESGSSGAVALLVNASAKVDLRNNMGRTALMLAAMNGRGDVVRELLKANPQLNLSDNDGNTALIHSSRKGHWEVVSVLLNAGANANIRNKEGKVALLYATDKNIKYALERKTTSI